MTDLQKVIALWVVWAEHDPPSLRGANAANEAMALVPDLVQEVEVLRGQDVAVRW